MSPSRERPRNMAASVRERLTQQARSRSANVQLVMTRYAIERLLYRLNLSQHRERFVLKGAMLFAVWANAPYRTTADLDLLGSGDPEPQLLARAIREVCSVVVEDDGVTFLETPRTRRARDGEQPHEGLLRSVGDGGLPGVRRCHSRPGGRRRRGPGSRVDRLHDHGRGSARRHRHSRLDRRALRLCRFRPPRR